MRSLSLARSFWSSTGGAPSAPSSCGDLAVQPVSLEHQVVDLDRLAARRLALGGHHQLPDVVDQLLVVAVQALQRLVQMGDQPLARPGADGRGEMLVGQPLQIAPGPHRARKRTSPAAPSRGALERSALASRRRGAPSASAASGFGRGRLRPSATRRPTRPGSASSRSATSRHQLLAGDRVRHRRDHLDDLVERPVPSRRRSQIGVVEQRPHVEDRQVLRFLDRLPEPRRRRASSARQQIRRVLPVGHPRHPQPQPLPARHPLRAQHRLACRPGPRRAPAPPPPRIPTAASPARA